MKRMAQRRSGSWGPRTEQPGTASDEAAIHEWEPEWAEAAMADRLEAVRAQRGAARSRLRVLVPAAVVAGVAPTVLWWTPCR